MRKSANQLVNGFIFSRSIERFWGFWVNGGLFPLFPLNPQLHFLFFHRCNPIVTLFELRMPVLLSP